MPEMVNFYPNWTSAQPNLLNCSKLTMGNKNKHPDIFYVLNIWQIFPATLNLMLEMVHFDPNCTFTQPNVIINSELSKGNKTQHTGILLVQYIWQWCPATLHFSLEMAIIPPFTWECYSDLAIFCLKSNKMRYHRDVECTTASKSKEEWTKVFKNTNHHFVLIGRQ